MQLGANEILIFMAFCLFPEPLCSSDQLKGERLQGISTVAFRRCYSSLLPVVLSSKWLMVSIRMLFVQGNLM